MEEGGGQHSNNDANSGRDAPRKEWRVPPNKKRKKKYGIYVRKEENRKLPSTSASAANPTMAAVATVAETAATTNATTAAAATTATTTKSTKAEIIKALAYSTREIRKSARKSSSLAKKLVDDQAGHKQAMEKLEVRLNLKSTECNSLVTLAQENRKHANLCSHEADCKVSAMAEEGKIIKLAAEAHASAAEASATNRVRAERAYQHTRMKKQCDRYSLVLDQLSTDHSRQLSTALQHHQLQSKQECAAREVVELVHVKVVCQKDWQLSSQKKLHRKELGALDWQLSSQKMAQERAGGFRKQAQ